MIGEAEDLFRWASGDDWYGRFKRFMIYSEYKKSIDAKKKESEVERKLLEKDSSFSYAVKFISSEWNSGWEIAIVTAMLPGGEISGYTYYVSEKDTFGYMYETYFDAVTAAINEVNEMSKKFEIGQKVYVKKYDSIGRVVKISDDLKRIWYGVESLDGKFGMHNCGGREEYEITEKIEGDITGCKCEWFLGKHLEELV